MHGEFHCAVASCVHHLQQPDESIGMVDFPTDNGELTNVWMQRCGVQHVVPGITRICARHFQPDDFTVDLLWQTSNPGQPNPRPSVRPGAVPSRQLALNPFSWSTDGRHLLLDVQSAAPPVKRKRVARGRPSSRRPQLSPTERFDPEVRASLVQAAIDDYEVRKKDITSTDWDYVSRTAAGLSVVTKRRLRRGSGMARRSRRPITTLRDDPICRSTLQNGFDSVGESLWMDALSPEVNDQEREMGKREVKQVSIGTTSSSAQVINVNFIVEPQLPSTDNGSPMHNFGGGITTAATSTRTSLLSNTQKAKFSNGSAGQTVSIQDMIDEDDKEFRFRLPHWMPDRSRELLLWRRHLQRMTRRLDREGRRSNSQRLLVLRDDILMDVMDAGSAEHSLQPPFADTRTSPSTLVDALEVLHRQRLENMQMRATMLLANMRHRRLAARLEQAGMSSDWPAEAEGAEVADVVPSGMNRCEWTELDLQRARELSDMCTAEAYNYVKDVFKVPLPNLDVLAVAVSEETNPGIEIARERVKNRVLPTISFRKRCSSGNSFLVQGSDTLDEVTAPLSWDFDWNHLGSTNYGSVRQSEAIQSTHHGHFEGEDNDRVLKIEETEGAVDLDLQNIVFDPSLMIESTPFVTAADRCNRTLDISKTDAKLSSRQITKSGVPVDVVRRNRPVVGGVKLRDSSRLTHEHIRPSQCAISWLDP